MCIKGYYHNGNSRVPFPQGLELSTAPGSSAPDVSETAGKIERRVRSPSQDRNRLNYWIYGNNSKTGIK